MNFRLPDCPDAAQINSMKTVSFRRTSREKLYLATIERYRDELDFSWRPLYVFNRILKRIGL